ELASPAYALPVQAHLGASDRASDDALEQSARAPRRRLGQYVLAGAVEPDHGVVVDGAAALELGRLDEAKASDVAEPVASDAELAREVAARCLHRPLPQRRRQV